MPKQVSEARSVAGGGHQLRVHQVSAVKAADPHPRFGCEAAPAVGLRIDALAKPVVRWALRRAVR
jgi:hypothetical protein